MSSNIQSRLQAVQGVGHYVYFQVEQEVRRGVWRPVVIAIRAEVGRIVRWAADEWLYQ